VAAGLPFRITVCGFAELNGCRDLGASDVLSILDPNTPMPSEITGLSVGRRLELRFHDVIEELPDMRLPIAADVAAILALGRELGADAAANRHLLLHCHAGFSRSPAALALLVAQAWPAQSANAISDEVLRVRPNAWPNLRIIELGDRLLGRSGQLVEATAIIYRRRLAQDPSLAELMQQNHRQREIEAARRWQTSLGRKPRAPSSP
jgi:predicted protein tyrosine phosphatase